MLALAAALAFQFTGTTAQNLPLVFTRHGAVIRSLAVVVRADCGRFGTVSEAERFPPVRVYGGSFRAVAREVPANVFPQGDVAIVSGRFVSRHVVRGTVTFRARRSDPSAGWIICTSIGVRWKAVAP
jgi:hypothetical protein